MFKLHNWVQELVQSFTFYGGGGSGGGGGGTTTSKTSSELDPTVRPFVEYGLQEAKTLYGTPGPSYYPGATYVGPSTQTTESLKAAEAAAKAGSPLTGAAMGQQYDVLTGKYLAPNPYFEAAMRPAVTSATTAYNDAIKGAFSTSSLAGRYGSGAMADLTGRANKTLADTLAGKAGELAYTNYANERARQESAAGLAPSLQASKYADIQQLANVGKTSEGYQQTALQSAIDRYNYEQNLPYQKLSAYLGAAYGSPMGQVSTSQQQSSGGGKIVCTAMNAEYGFGSFRNAIWLSQSKNLDPAYEKGYHALFLPLVNYAYKAGEKNTLQRILRGVLEHIARHRTADIWKQKRGKTRDNYGMIYRAILEPICYVVGKVGK
jgi:hypothetical protein